MCLTCPRRLLLLLMREEGGDLRAELLVAGEERLERGDRLADPAEHELVEQRLKRELIPDIWGKRGATYGEKGCVESCRTPACVTLSSPP